MSENAPENTDANEGRDERETEPHGEETRNDDKGGDGNRRESTDSRSSADRDKPHGEPRADTDWEAEARKWEKRAKANHDAAKRLDKLERANESDAQRLERERDEARQNAESSTSELARLRAAMRYGLAEDDLDLLGTGTAEEIDERAKRLADRLGAAAKKPPASRRPAESLRGGNDPEREPEETDLSKLGARMFNR